jgi:hypothetical protein
MDALRPMHLGETVEIVLAVVAGVIFPAAMLLYCAAIWAAYILDFTIVYCDQRLRVDGTLPGGASAESGSATGGIVPA